MNEHKERYWNYLMGKVVKTTPENVEQAHQALFHDYHNNNIILRNWCYYVYFSIVLGKFRSDQR